MHDPHYQGEEKNFCLNHSCGPTVYYTPHIGNLRATFTADLIRNVLKYFGLSCESCLILLMLGILFLMEMMGDKLEKGAKGMEFCTRSCKEI